MKLPWDKVLESLNTGVIIVSERGELLFANRFCVERGIVTENFKGRKFYESVRSLDLIGFISDCLEGKVSEDVLSVGDRHYRVRVALREPLLLEVEDVSRDVNLERMQKEFIASVSHELGTPVSAVKSMLELSLLKDPPERTFIERALFRIKELEGILVSLRTLLSVEYGKSSSFERVDLKEIVEEVLSSLVEDIEERNISLETQLCPESLIEGDRSKIYILVRNILENAVRYNREGGKVRITLSRGEDRVTLEVKDTGYGIPKEELPLIFVPFFGGKNKKGLGLGLYMCKKIADLHGADIEISSEEGRGTVVRVSFRVSQ